MRFHHLPRFVALAALLLCQRAIGAESKSAVESFFSDPKIAQVVLSPKGGYVAVLSRAATGGYLVAVIDTSDPSKITIAASSKTDKIVTFHWVNENRLTFTLKQEKLEFEGNYDEIAADRDGANQLYLISGDWRHYQKDIGSNFKSNVLPADHAYYAPTHDGSDDFIVKQYIFGEFDGQQKTSRLMRLNSRTGKLSPTLVARQPASVTNWVLDEHALPRLASTRDKGRCALHYRAAGSEQWKEINNTNCVDSGWTPLNIDDRDTLYMIAPYQNHDALFSYDLKTMQLAKEPLIAIDGFDFSGSAEVVEPGERVAGFHFLGDAHGSHWFAPEMQQIQQKVNALLPQRSNRITCGERCQQSAALLVTSQSDRQPPQYFLYKTATNQLVALGDAYPRIQAADMGWRDFHRFAARDGLSIPVYVTTPPGKAGGPRPTVVLVHGGPHVRGSSWEWDDEAQFLASRGYLVLQVEYRGSTGFGGQHFRAGWKQWGGAMQDDLADAVAWSVKQGWTDPKRVAIMGASYGGYAALMGLIKHPTLYRCGVDYAGVSDLALMYNTPQDDSSADSRDFFMPMLVGDKVADAAALAANSPLSLAAKLSQPVLIGHGGLDRRVPIVHATKMRDALERHNKQVSWVAYGDEAHGLRQEANRIDYYKRVEAFLAKHM